MKRRLMMIDMASYDEVVLPSNDHWTDILTVMGLLDYPKYHAGYFSWIFSEGVITTRFNPFTEARLLSSPPTKPNLGFVKIEGSPDFVLNAKTAIDAYI